MPPTIKNLIVRDIRFPTSDRLDGSDAIHTDPDYSAAYVVLETDEPGLEGHGLAFTLGRGNELCVAAIHALEYLVIGKPIPAIAEEMRDFWRRLTNDSQLRWIGPEKGVIHFATAAIVNAVWDIHARMQRKPLWRLLSDLSPKDVVACIDFRYITDALTPDEALEILSKNEFGKEDRAAELQQIGLPTYTSSAGWMGYDDDRTRALCCQYMAEGWTAFKMKVGSSIEQDVHRAQVVRDAIGLGCTLMVDANQAWDVPQAIDHMHHLAPFQPLWIEEPTSPDDILGHVAIAKAIAPIGVATGEAVSNRVMFKQFLQSGGISFCQIDSCRLGGVNENLAVLLLAARYGVPVCPHAGGVGLPNHVQHLSAFNYIAVSPSLENVLIEYSDHLHEHFVNPVKVKKARYRLPTQPGYGVMMKPESLYDYEFPDGPIWAGRR